MMTPMILSLIINLLSALLFTALIELFIVFIFGYRDRLFFVVVFLINVITNPILNYIVSLPAIRMLHRTFEITLILEIVVIFVEWFMLAYVFKKESKIKLFALSSCMNIASFLFGIFLFWFY